MPKGIVVVEHAGRRISVWTRKVPKSPDDPSDTKVLIHLKIEAPDLLGFDNVVIALPSHKARALADILSDASEGLILQEVMDG